MCVYVCVCLCLCVHVCACACVYVCVCLSSGPHAIKSFFDEAKRNESLIQGAWVFMLECDYVWMQPMQVGLAAQTNTLTHTHTADHALCSPPQHAARSWYAVTIVVHSQAAPASCSLRMHASPSLCVRVCMCMCVTIL